MFVCSLIFLFLITTFSHAQEIEILDGVRIVHNEKGGEWGKDLKASLRLIRILGGLDVENEHLAFNGPRDVVLDSEGNMYIVDYSNNRIQKLSPGGEYISTIGREGQGPGDLSRPYSIDIDSDDNLYVLDSRNRRIQIFNTKGEVQKVAKLDKFRQNTIRSLPSGLIALGGRLDMRWALSDDKELPKLLELVDRKGNVLSAFGQLRDYENRLVNWAANEIEYDVDQEGSFFLSFAQQNRIEKYTPDGRLVWKADRVLNYDTKVIDKGYIERSESGGTGIQVPKLNLVSCGIALDVEGRTWVITFNRQLRPEEMSSSVSAGGVTRRLKTAEFKTMDIYKLEIFNPDGILLGEIQLDHLAHKLRIQRSYLFIFDLENAQIFQYEIIEKSH